VKRAWEEDVLRVASCIVLHVQNLKLLAYCICLIRVLPAMVVSSRTGPATLSLQFALDAGMALWAFCY